MEYYNTYKENYLAIRSRTATYEYGVQTNNFKYSSPVNGLLGVKSLPIADQEFELYRETRTMLMQLRYLNIVQ